MYICMLERERERVERMGINEEEQMDQWEGIQMICNRKKKQKITS